MAVDPDLFESMRLELRRGSLVLAVLACLRTERYGYTLRQALAERASGARSGAHVLTVSHELTHPRLQLAGQVDLRFDAYVSPGATPEPLDEASTRTLYVHRVR